MSRTELSKAREAATLLWNAHAQRLPFGPLPDHLMPSTPGEAYDVQDDLVALKSDRYGSVAGWKIALTTPQMRAMVGVDQPIAGTLHRGQIQPSPGRVQATDYSHLIVEFEIAVELAEDLPAADAPYTRDRVAQAVGAVMPAFELADDRNADYRKLSRHALLLAADNAWNEGAVLGEPVTAWRTEDLAALRGIVSINGEVVGEGHGRDAMGHPFEAVAWIANHLAARGHGLWRGAVVITGSLVQSRFPVAGDSLHFSLGTLGQIDLVVE